MSVRLSTEDFFLTLLASMKMNDSSATWYGSLTAMPYILIGVTALP